MAAFFGGLIGQNTRSMRIYVEGVNEDFMLGLAEFFAEHRIRVISLTRKAENKWYKKDTGAMIELDLGRKQHHEQILEGIKRLEGLRYVEEVL